MGAGRVWSYVAPQPAMRPGARAAGQAAAGRGLCVYTPPGPLPRATAERKVLLSGSGGNTRLTVWGAGETGQRGPGTTDTLGQGSATLGDGARCYGVGVRATVLSNPPRGGAGSEPGMSGVTSWKQWCPRGTTALPDPPQGPAVTRGHRCPLQQRGACGQSSQPCTQHGAQGTHCVWVEAALFPEDAGPALSLLRTLDSALGRPGSRILFVGEGTSPGGQAMGAKAESQIKHTHKRVRATPLIPRPWPGLSS